MGPTSNHSALDRQKLRKMYMDVVVKKMATKMAMKRPNCQGIRMSGNSDVLDDTDLLEEILVRVPHEFIFNCILVSKRWFGLIRGSCFLEHYIKRWSDEVNLMRHQNYSEPSAEGNELQHGLQSQQLAALDQLQHRLQSQQLAALDQLLHRVALNQLHHRPHHSRELAGLLHLLHSRRVDALNSLHHKLQLAAENQSEPVIHDLIWDVQEALVRFMVVNKWQQEHQSEVLAEVKGLLKYFIPSQRWAAVNEVQHQIVCELLVAVNEAQRQQYWDMIDKPYGRCLTYKYQQWISETSVAPSTATPAELQD